MTYAALGLDARSLPANYYAYHTQDYMDEEGQKFRVEYHYDVYCDPPWEHGDIHGDVTEWEDRDKRPGELILAEDRHGYKRFYDFQGAVKRARHDNWCCWDKELTPQARGEALNTAVIADYRYLRDWCNDEWHYMGIVAFPLTADNDELRSKEQSVWGIESASDSAWIQENIDNLLSELGASGQVTELKG